MIYKSISTKYILVERLEKEETTGFKTVEVQDNFVYKGKVKQRPEMPLYVDNHCLQVGDIVLWAKYSPDSFDIDGYKFVAVNDLLAVL